tara:strand:+ start:147 stop:383 length:237 start_codon:yes stop_codon:yes gene_type:complete
VCQGQYHNIAILLPESVLSRLAIARSSSAPRRELSAQRNIDVLASYCFAMQEIFIGMDQNIQNNCNKYSDTALLNKDD